MKTIDRIATLLKQTMGLDVASVGILLIERAVNERAAALGSLDADQYLLALQNIPGEMQELIEMVIVPETWFFRDREAILAVAKLAREKTIQRPASILRILSLPCSTGEEPYSIAMALLDIGIPPARFRIDAIDICTRSLAIAKRAHYGRNSFRGKALDFRKQHFTMAGDSYALSEDAQRQVNFSHGNIFAADFLQNEPAYDFIFCRNVLIYFDRETQQQTLQMLDRLLAKDGTIFVGPAEAGMMLRPGFASAGIPLAFAFCRKAIQPVVARKIEKIVAPLKTVVVPPAIPKKKIVQSKPVQTSDSAEAILARAMQFANQGAFTEALNLCTEHQHLAGPSAASFYLMGLIADAQQNTSHALQLYRKAVYLQPDHVEALTHIAALLAAQGDASGAQLMQRRAQRMKEHSDA